RCGFAGPRPGPLGSAPFRRPADCWNRRLSQVPGSVHWHPSAGRDEGLRVTSVSSGLRPELLAGLAAGVAHLVDYHKFPPDRIHHTITEPLHQRMPIVPRSGLVSCWILLDVGIAGVKLPIEAIGQ